MDSITVDFLKERIKELDSAIEIEKIEKGWSFDLKYIVKYKNRERLLRIYDINIKDNVIDKLEKMKTLFNIGVKCPKIYSYGEITDKGICY